MRNWLTRLWRLSYPTICCLQGGDPGALGVRFQSESRGLRTRKPMMVSVPPARGQEKTLSAPAGRQEASCGESFLPLPFSIQALNWLEDAHPHGGVQSTSLSPIQMLRPSGTTLTHTHRNNVESEHPLAQRNCHIKIAITRRLCWCWRDSPFRANL